MQQWLDRARKRKLKYHPWVDEWLHARAQIEDVRSAGPAQINDVPTKSRIYGPKAERKKNILDSIINKAIEQAGSEHVADVFPILRHMVIEEEIPPFTGIVRADGLEYTDSENRKKLLSRDALAKRLNRRRDRNRH